MAFVERKIARIVQKEVMPELTKMINKQLQENRVLLLEKIHEFPELIENLVKSEVKKHMEKELNCCFCKTDKGALVRLYQGWCCFKCFFKMAGVD